MKELYNSPYLFPLLPLLATPFVFLLGLRVRDVLGWIVAAFSIEIALDAWLTGVWSPTKGPVGFEWLIPVTFVILGDLRYFLVIEVCATKRLAARGVLLATALAFVVPVTTQLARVAFKRVHDEDAVNYLVYELSFLLLAIVMRTVVVKRRMPEGDPRDFALRVTNFEIVQYGLWACADILILNGFESVGYGLRIIPNLLYYVAFLPFVLYSSRSWLSARS